MGITSKKGAALTLALALALVCVHPGNALAAGVDNPVDPVTGLPLPLKPYEKVHLTADGKCGIISDVKDNFDRTNFTWQGACRFGLAHGWGYTIGTDGKAYWMQFTYGWRDLAPGVPAGFTKTYRDNRSWGADYAAVSFVDRDHFDPARYYDNTAATVLQTQTGDTYVAEFVGVRFFACPYKGFAEAPNYKPDKQQIALARKACSKRKYDGATGYFIFEERMTQVRNGAGQWIDGAPKIQNVRVCEPVPASDSVPTCEGEAIYAAAPLMDRITAVMAADKTAVINRRKELIARFAPLEVALNARTSAFAAGSKGR